VVLAHSVAQPPDFEGTWFDAPTHDTAYAQQLYGSLRALDALAADENLDRGTAGRSGVARRGATGCAGQRAL